MILIKHELKQGWKSLAVWTASIGFFIIICVFLYPEMKLARNTPPIDGPTGISQQLDYNAFYKSNDQNSSVIVTLINKTASYTKGA